MKNNRRNYYRILQVQPEAPLDVIRASYRTLMSKLRHHPDLGGDHEAAVLLNEAWAVLSDPARRRQYDRILARERAGGDGRPHAATGTPPLLPPPRTDASAHSRLASIERQYAPHADYACVAPAPGASARANPRHPASCAFCGLDLPPLVSRDTRCRRCESPLAPPTARFGGDETSCRRALLRVAMTGAVLIREDWRQRPAEGRLRDLSLSGISVVAATAPADAAVLRITGSSFDVLAQLVSCRRDGVSYSLHARLLTVVFAERPGVFVSMTA